MRFAIFMTAAAVLCVSSMPANAKTAPAAKAAFQLNGTTWTYTDKGTKVRESIDAHGNYIENSVNGKHIDHGTAEMKDGKACFTSAMTKDGEMCWTTSPTRIGHSMLSASDKGQKLKVTRVKYVPLSMPK